MNNLEKEKKSLCNEVTFVIPTLGRKNELKQLLDYFASNELASQLLILETGNRCHKIVDEYQDHLNIQLKSFSPKVSFVKKIIEGSKQINTPYVCICTDDDLVLIDCVLKCVEFLKKNPCYTACQGGHCLFEQNEQQVSILDYLWRSQSLESSDPLHRLSALFQAYQPICWAVYPKAIFSEIFKALKKYQNIGDVFFELIWSTTSVLHGKTKRLPDIYCLRRSDLIKHPGHPFYYFLNSSSNFFKDYSRYKNYLRKKIYLPQIPKARIKYLLDLIHAKYFCIEFDKEKANFAIGKLLENHKLDIYSNKIFNVIKTHPPKFNQDQAKIFEIKGLKYHCSSSFLQSYYELISGNEGEGLTQMFEHITSYFNKNSQLFKNVGKN